MACDIRNTAVLTSFVSYLIYKDVSCEQTIRVLILRLFEQEWTVSFRDSIQELCFKKSADSYSHLIINPSFISQVFIPNVMVLFFIWNLVVIIHWGQANLIRRIRVNRFIKSVNKLLSRFHTFYSFLISFSFIYCRLSNLITFILTLNVIHFLIVQIHFLFVFFDCFIQSVFLLL